MTTDSELLRQYVSDHSEPAFRELVQRRLGMVYSVALRRTGKAHLAEEVSQMVFIALARKAPALASREVLAGWLYRSTQYAASKAMRTEWRRQKRQQEMIAMMDPNENVSEPDWEKLRPVLEEAVGKLPAPDRDAVLLRFIDAQSYAEIGARLAMNENTARMRVERALVKLHVTLARRGVGSTAGALALALSSQWSAAAPAGLATTISSGALAGGGSLLASAAIRCARIATTAKTAGGIAGILGLATALGTGIALREVTRNRQAQDALSASRHEFEVETAHLRSLEQTAQQAKRARIAPKFRAPTIAAGTAMDPREAGRKFLKAFPEARSLLLQSSIPAISLAFAPFFRSANLTPAQVSRFEDLMASTWLKNLSVTPTEMGAGAGEPTDEQLNEILGEQGAQEYRTYQQTLQYPYKYMATVAAGAAEMGAALTNQQVDALAQIIAYNSRPYHTVPGSLGPQNSKAAMLAVNWDSAAAQAQASLPPGQFGAVEHSFLGMQLNIALYQILQDRAQTPGNAPQVP